MMRSFWWRFQLSFLTIFVLVCTTAWADPVSDKTIVHTIGSNFLDHMLPYHPDIAIEKSGISADSILEITDHNTNTILAFAYTVSSGGFVIISADTDLPPVIAYSFRKNWSADTGVVNHFYPILTYDLENRLEHLDAIPEAVRRKNNRAWQTYMQEKPEIAAAATFQQWPEYGTTITGGWLETTWTQRAPYNNFCPLNPDDGQRYPSGCGPTAIAQIVNYHRHIGGKRFSDDDAYQITNPDIRIDADYQNLDFPSFGELNGYLDSLEYRYAHNLPLTDDDKAALCFACGIVTNTRYSVSGSAIYTYELYQAFTEKLGYSSAEFRSVNSGFYDDLIRDMKEGLPAELSLLSSEGGHAVVCDGYNTEGFFHLNFGWGDIAPEAITEAWYALPGGIPQDYDFIYNAVINIKPDLEYYEYIEVSDTLMVFEPSRIDELSDEREWILENTGEETIEINRIVMSENFLASINGSVPSDSLGPIVLPPGHLLQVNSYCKPDSLGKFRGAMQISAKVAGNRRYMVVELVGYGQPQSGSLITQMALSGRLDKGGAPYYIVDDVEVEGSLEIEAGTEILVQSPYAIRIGPGARFRAIGTESDSVVFSPYNKAHGWRGLRFEKSGDDDSLVYCVLKDGKVPSGNGGVVYLDETNLTIRDSRFHNNNAGLGGAIYSSNANPDISGSVFQENSSNNGGVLYLIDSSPHITNCIFNGNQANTGAAIYARTSDLRLTNSSFSSNSAKLIGGVFDLGNSRADISQCVFIQNTAGRGGVFSLGKTTVFLRNSMLNGNKARESGDISFYESSEILIQNITAVNQTVAHLTELFMPMGKTYLEVRNSVFWDSYAGEIDIDSQNNETARFAQALYEDTLVFHFSNLDSGLINSVQNNQEPFVINMGHKIISQDPLFQNAENNDFRLQKGSPCIDSGDPRDDVGKEPFPHGFCRNLGVFGGTSEAQKTPGTKITVSPDPVDFGELSTPGIQDMTVYLKNGSANDIHVTDINIKNENVFHFSQPGSENEPYEYPFTLKSGEMDSFRIRLEPPAGEEHILADSLDIHTSEMAVLNIPLYGQLYAGTHITGTISGTLSKQNSPYIVDGILTVPENASLIIEPGVHLKFAGPYYLGIGKNACLKAIGTREDSIWFSAKNREIGWMGIRLHNSGDNDSLTFCSIRHVNTGPRSSLAHNNGALSLESSVAYVSNCLFAYNGSESTSQVYCSESEIEIKHCRFEYNHSSWFEINLRSSKAVIENCLFYRNSGEHCFYLFSMPDGSSAYLNNVTITQNQYNGELIRFFNYGNENGFFTIENSIIWNNPNTSGILMYTNRGPVSMHHSIIDTTTEDWFWEYNYPSEPAPSSNYEWGEGNLCTDPLFTDAENGDLTLRADSPCIDAGNPDPLYNDTEDPLNPGYALWPAMGTVRNDMGAYGGQSIPVNRKRTDLPGSSILVQNFPNPFNALTTIEFYVTRTGPVKLVIYNLLGQKIRMLLNRELEEGYYKKRWDGRDDTGRSVPSGIYFYRLQCGKINQTKKMVLLQ